MSRELGLRDVTALRAVKERALKFDFDVVHGHGAKGGAYSRLVARAMKRAGEPVVSCYTPHGGSLHYHPSTATGASTWGSSGSSRATPMRSCSRAPMQPRAIRPRSARPACATRVIPNGLAPEEFAQPSAAPGAADFLFVGELRHLKGVDVLLRALAQVRARRTVSAVIVGAGPDAAKYTREAAKYGLDGVVTFIGPMPAREAFRLGRTPGRAVARREPALHRPRGGRRRPAAACDRCRRHPRDRRRHRYGPASAGRCRCARARHDGSPRQPCCRAQAEPSACARPSPSASPSKP